MQMTHWKMKNTPSLMDRIKLEKWVPGCQTQRSEFACTRELLKALRKKVIALPLEKEVFNRTLNRSDPTGIPFVQADVVFVGCGNARKIARHVFRGPQLPSIFDRWSFSYRVAESNCEQ